MAITKADNKVTVDGSSEPFGGCVVALSYNVAFDGPSTMSVTVANDSGSYGTPTLNETSSVKFGSQEAIDMIPTSYRTSSGGGGKTLTVNYDDMSMEHLDKTLVLLKYKHLTDGSVASNVLALGYMFTPGPSGEFERYYGTYQPGIDVKYNLADLHGAMGGMGVPMGKGVGNFMTKFGPSLDNASEASVALQNAFLRNETGTLRSVLAAVAGSMGVVFYWNNEGGGAGELDVIEMSGSLGADVVEDTLAGIDNSCNILDSSSSTSIKNCFVVGAIGSFSTTSGKTSGSGSEPYARFRFMDMLESPYAGGQGISIGADASNITRMEKDKETKGNPLLYDLEMLMKAAVVSPEYYKRFILLKQLSQMFARVKEDMDITNVIMDEKNQKVPKNKTKSQFGGKWFGEAKGGGDEKAGYLNIARNKAVERLYPYNSDFPAGSGGFTFLPSAYSGSGGLKGANKAAVLKNHSLAGYHFYVHIAEDKQFLSQCGAGNPWVGCIFKLGSLTDRIIDDVSSEPIYKTVKFLSQNFGRYYYSVGETSSGSGGKTKREKFGRFDRPNEVSTERPALLTQRKVAARNYAGRGPQWVFSDLAVSDTPYAALWAFTRGEAGADALDWTEKKYSIQKMGQSSPPIVFLPSDVRSPARRKFRATGYKSIQSIYDYIRYFPDDTVHPSICAESQGGSSSQTYTNVGGFSHFVCEVYGSFTDTSIVKYGTTPAEGFTGRGTVTLPGTSGSSMSADAYATINAWRSDCKDGYKYPTDLDCGVLLYEAYSGTTEGVVERPPAFTHYNSDTIEELFAVEGGEGFPEGGDGGIGAFVIQVPRGMPEKAPQQVEWGPDIKPDHLDLQLYKVALPFSLAKIQNRMRLSYSYPMDDRLMTFRASCIPKSGRDTKNATSFDMRNVSFDVSELQPKTNNFGTEFPRCKSGNSTVDLQEALKSLESMIQGYTDSQLEPAVSHEYTVSGFGFGDSNSLPSIQGGLESLSISLGANGVTTKIKIGNTRRARASDEMRKAMMISELAGAPLARTKQGSVTTTFSNHFLTNT